MMTRKHVVTIAKVIRDSSEFGDRNGRLGFAAEMADALDQGDMVKNFDRDLFMAYATSATE